MKFAFLPQAIDTIGNLETIGLTLWDHHEPGTPATIDIVWSRGPKTNWNTPYFINLLAASPGILLLRSSLMGSLARLCEKHGLESMDSPHALIDLLEKSNAIMFCTNAAGEAIKAIDLLEKVDSDEFITNSEGMRRRLSCRASDELVARKLLTKALLEAAQEDPAHVDDFSLWLKAGQPVKKIGKRESAKLPDLSVYCERGKSRGPLVLAKKSTAKEATAK
jgi:hypothetical protein